MEKVKTENDVLEVVDCGTSDPQLVEKEVELGYFDNYLFEGTGPSKHFQGSCTRIHYCSCNCHDCSFVSSDARLKKDVKSDVPGLVFIKKLRPVTYHFERNADTLVRNSSVSLNQIDPEEIINNRLQTGFIAQEVEATAKEVGFEFNGIIVPKDENEYYALRYSSFVVPLVKAVQELSIKNESLQRNIENQNQEIEKLHKIVKELILEKSMA